MGGGGGGLCCRGDAGQWDVGEDPVSFGDELRKLASPSIGGRCDNTDPGGSIRRVAAIFFLVGLFESLRYVSNCQQNARDSQLELQARISLQNLLFPLVSISQIITCRT